MQQIGIIPFQQSGYMPLVDFEEWRVAVLKFCDDLLIENISSMQKHLLTDEVFVLLKGECTLFLAGDGECTGELQKVKMHPGNIYVIKKGVWHNHIMSGDGEVLIVENRNTSDDNSPVTALTDAEIKQLRSL